MKLYTEIPDLKHVYKLNDAATAKDGFTQFVADHTISIIVLKAKNFKSGTKGTITKIVNKMPNQRAFNQKVEGIKIKPALLFIQNEEILNKLKEVFNEMFKDQFDSTTWSFCLLNNSRVPQFHNTTEKVSFHSLLKSLEDSINHILTPPQST